MTEIPESFVEEQVEELKEREDVEAVAVVGSYARDPEGDHNDLDLYIIVDGDWRRRVTEEIDSIVVEKFFNSMDWAESYFKEKGKWHMVRWMENIDVRHDPENCFETLREKAETKKERYLEEDLDEERLLYGIWDLKQDIETDDVGQKRYMMYKAFDHLLEKLYEKEGVIPVKDNYRVEKLQEFDGYMYKLAQDFLTSSSTHEKEKKLEKMIEHVAKGLGSPKPEWETEKEYFSD